LLALRVDLRWRNLIDTETAALDPPGRANFDVGSIRTADGSFNDLAKPWMGWRMHVSAKSTKLVRSFPTCRGNFGASLVENADRGQPVRQFFDTAGASV